MKFDWDNLEKCSTYAEFEKNSKNDEKMPPGATWLSKYIKCTINRDFT